MLKQHSTTRYFVGTWLVLCWLSMPRVLHAQNDRIPSLLDTAPPTATFQGSIQPPPGSGAWDPYGPAVAQPQPLPQVVQPGNVPAQPNGTLFGPGSQAPAGQVTRFLQQVRLRETWLAGNGGDRKLGVNDIETSATFALPFRFFTQQAAVNQAPLLLTPGFSLHLWDGPAPGPSMMETADMPPQTYDAYLDTAWLPEFNPQFAADLAVRVGVYSDFEKLNSRSLRVTGRALGVYTLNPRMRIAAGIVYLDRQKVKLLPAGGLIWTPNEDTRYHILFPNPKLSKRLTWQYFGSADVWWFVSGEYGGGSWTIKRTDGDSDVVDYNDLRVLLGLEWETPRGLKGDVAIGYVFDRELIYRSNDPDNFDPRDTGLIRASFSF